MNLDYPLVGERDFIVIRIARVDQAAAQASDTPALDTGVTEEDVSLFLVAIVLPGGPAVINVGSAIARSLKRGGCRTEIAGARPGDGVNVRGALAHVAVAGQE